VAALDDRRVLRDAVVAAPQNAGNGRGQVSMKTAGTSETVPIDRSIMLLM
jgi:hypothetical protein